MFCWALKQVKLSVEIAFYAIRNLTGIADTMTAITSRQISAPWLNSRPTFVVHLKNFAANKTKR
jgi:hypothetical protein